jgi:hypothetical protein
MWNSVWLSEVLSISKEISYRNHSFQVVKTYSESMVNKKCTGLSWFLEESKLHPTIIGKLRLETLVPKLQSQTVKPELPTTDYREVFHANI